MGKYEFDREIDRRGTGSLKVDFAMQRIGRDDLLPMWVADMDFALPEEVLAPIRARIDHGIFGYTEPDDRYYDVLEKWFRKRYGWEIRREWNTAVPGVVYGLTCAIRALTKPGEAVLIQEPVYYPFRMVIEDNGRICVSQPLLEKNGRYEMDFDGLEQAVVKNHVRAMILCSPHNPVGRVWTREELEKLDRICRKHGVFVIADEIHCDFILPGNRFTPFGTLGRESAANAVICTSPSKSFNMAGMQVSNILILDPQIREAFRRENEANGYSQPGAVGLEAARAAYEFGEEWLDELIVYLADNIEYFRAFLAENLPQLRLIEPEGTYLLWVDFSGVEKDPEELKRRIRDDARLWLDDGIIFGENGALFERFNIACPRRTVERALRQLADAFKQ